VKKGETLGGIAEKYKVSFSSIQQLNNINGTKIIAGQELKIPNPTGTTSQKPKDGYHTVENGETLYSIAIKYNTSVQKIKTLNNLSSSKIIIGQKLRVS
jgi:LysM repeat protein